MLLDKAAKNVSEMASIVLSATNQMRMAIAPS